MKKTLAAALSVLYFLSNVALLHASESNIWEERKKLALSAVQPVSFQNKALLANPNPVHPDIAKLPSSIAPYVNAIPLNSGAIKEFHSAGGPMVVLIQDVHMNNEAQRNIANILLALNAKAAELSPAKRPVIGVEGAFGKFDFTPFRAFDDKAKIKTVSDQFLQENKFAAPSYAGITAERVALDFHGIDDPKHYIANVQAYLSSRETKPAIATRLEKEKQELAARKQSALNPALKRFDAKRSAHESGRLGMGEYAEYLSNSEAELELVVEQFVLAYRMEKSLDFAAVERERARVVEKLAKKLSKEEINTLATAGIQFRAGQISFAGYYKTIKSLIDAHGIPLSATPAFDSYIRYVLLSDGIQAEQLMRATRRLEEKVLAGLARTPEEKELMGKSRQLYLVGKLLDFSLTPEEWEEYASSRQSFSRDLSSFESFYREADIRSDKMIENLIAKNPSLAAMVVGGFHTPHITQLLKKQGLSYAVVQPKITKIDGASGSEYLSIFAREKTPLDKLFEGEKLFLAPYRTAVGRPAGREAGSLFVQSMGAPIRTTASLSFLGLISAVSYLLLESFPLSVTATSIVWIVLSTYADEGNWVNGTRLSWLFPSRHKASAFGVIAVLLSLIVANRVDFFLGPIADRNWLALLYNGVFTFTGAIFFSFAIHVFLTNISAVFLPRNYSRTNGGMSLSQPRAPPLPPSEWPPVTIQVPVYKENFQDVIQPTLEKALVAAHERANVVVHDDGLMVFANDDLPGAERRIEQKRNNNEALTDDEIEIFQRLRFYRTHGIGFIARSKNNRRGLFKKASNLNTGMELAEAVEHRLSRSVAPLSVGAYESALRAEIQDFSVLVAAEGNIRIGDYIFLLDKDSEIPPDIIGLTLPEFLADPKLSFTQHRTKPTNSSDNYFADMIGRFTENIFFLGIAFATRGGDAPPLVGHNAALRKSAMREVRKRETDGKLKYWTEDRVSEDFELSIKLQTAGYKGLYIAFEGHDFGEGVTRTYEEEAKKFMKFAFGAMELVFNRFRDMPSKGILTDTFRNYLASPHVDWAKKMSLSMYLATYLAISSAFILMPVFLGVLSLGVPWWHITVSSVSVTYYNLIAFFVAGFLSSFVLRRRMASELGGRSWSNELGKEIAYGPRYFLFFMGLPYHFFRGVAAHFLGQRPVFGATNMDKLKAEPFHKIAASILRENRTQLLLSLVVLVFVGTAYVTWRPDGFWHFFFGLTLMAVGHIAAPFISNPIFMEKFTFRNTFSLSGIKFGLSLLALLTVGIGNSMAAEGMNPLPNASWAIGAFVFALMMSLLPAMFVSMVTVVSGGDENGAGFFGLLASLRSKLIALGYPSGMVKRWTSSLTESQLKALRKPDDVLKTPMRNIPHFKDRPGDVSEVFSLINAHFVPERVDRPEDTQPRLRLKHKDPKAALASLERWLQANPQEPLSPESRPFGPRPAKAGDDLWYRILVTHFNRSDVDSAIPVVIDALKHAIAGGANRTVLWAEGAESFESFYGGMAEFARNGESAAYAKSLAKLGMSEDQIARLLTFAKDLTAAREKSASALIDFLNGDVIAPLDIWAIFWNRYISTNRIGGPFFEGVYGLADTIADELVFEPMQGELQRLRLLQGAYEELEIAATHLGMLEEAKRYGEKSKSTLERSMLLRAMAYRGQLDKKKPTEAWILLKGSAHFFESRFLAPLPVQETTYSLPYRDLSGPLDEDLHYKFSGGPALNRDETLRREIIYRRCLTIFINAFGSFSAGSMALLRFMEGRDMVTGLAVGPGRVEIDEALLRSIFDTVRAKRMAVNPTLYDQPLDQRPSEWLKRTTEALSSDSSFVGAAVIPLGRLSPVVFQQVNPILLRRAPPPSLSVRFHRNPVSNFLPGPAFEPVQRKSLSFSFDSTAKFGLGLLALLTVAVGQSMAGDGAKLSPNASLGIGVTILALFMGAVIFLVSYLRRKSVNREPSVTAPAPISPSPDTVASPLTWASVSPAAEQGIIEQLGKIEKALDMISRAVRAVPSQAEPRGFYYVISGQARVLINGLATFIAAMPGVPFRKNFDEIGTKALEIRSAAGAARESEDAETVQSNMGTIVARVADINEVATQIRRALQVNQAEDSLARTVTYRPPEMDENPEAYVREALPVFLGTGESIVSIDKIKIGEQVITGGTFSQIFKVKTSARDFVVKLAFNTDMGFELGSDSMRDDIHVFDVLHDGKVVAPKGLSNVHLMDFYGKVLTEDGSPVMVIEELINHDAERFDNWVRKASPEKIRSAALLVIESLLFFRDKGLHYYDGQASNFLLTNNGTVVTPIDYGGYRPINTRPEPKYIPSIIKDMLVGALNHPVSPELLRELRDVYEESRAHDLVPNEQNQKSKFEEEIPILKADLAPIIEQWQPYYLLWIGFFFKHRERTLFQAAGVFAMFLSWAAVTSVLPLIAYAVFDIHTPLLLIPLILSSLIPAHFAQIEVHRVVNRLAVYWDVPGLTLPSDNNDFDYMNAYFNDIPSNLDKARALLAIANLPGVPPEAAREYLMQLAVLIGNLQEVEWAHRARLFMKGGVSFNKHGFLDESQQMFNMANMIISAEEPSLERDDVVAEMVESLALSGLVGFAHFYAYNYTTSPAVIFRAHLAIGVAMANRGQADEAMDEFRDAVALIEKVDDFERDYYRASVLEALGNCLRYEPYEDLWKEMVSGMELLLNHVEGLITVAEDLLRRHRFMMAIDTIDEIQLAIKKFGRVEAEVRASYLLRLAELNAKINRMPIAKSLMVLVERARKLSTLSRLSAYLEMGLYDAAGDLLFRIPERERVRAFLEIGKKLSKKRIWREALESFESAENIITANEALTEGESDLGIEQWTDRLALIKALAESGFLERAEAAAESLSWLGETNRNILYAAMAIAYARRAYDPGSMPMLALGFTEKKWMANRWNGGINPKTNKPWTEKEKNMAIGRYASWQPLEIVLSMFLPIVFGLLHRSNNFKEFITRQVGHAFILAATWLPSILSLVFAHDLQAAWFVLTFLIIGIPLNILSHRLYNYFAVKKNWGMLAMDFFPSKSSVPVWEEMRHAFFDPAFKGNIMLIAYLEEYFETSVASDFQTREEMLSALYHVYWNYSEDIRKAIKFLMEVTPLSDVELALKERADVPGTAMAYSPGGRYLAVGVSVGNKVRLIARWKGDETRELEVASGPIHSIRFSADGSWLAVLHGPDANRTLALFNAATGERVGEAALGNLGEVLNFSFSGDGSRMAVLHGPGANQTLTLFNAATGERVGEAVVGDAWGYSFSADGSQLAVLHRRFNNQTLTLFNAATGERELEAVLENVSYDAYDYSFSADGRRLALRYVSDGIPTLALFNAATGERELENLGGVRRAGWYSADGSRLAVAHDDGIAFFDTATGARVLEAALGNLGTVWGYLFSADGSRLAVLHRRFNNQILTLFDAATGERVGGAILGNVADAVWGRSFSADGSRLAVLHRRFNNQTLTLFNAATGERVVEAVVLGDVAGDMRAPLFCADGKELAVYGINRIIRFPFNGPTASDPTLALRSSQHKWMENRWNGGINPKTGEAWTKEEMRMAIGRYASYQPVEILFSSFLPILFGRLHPSKNFKEGYTRQVGHAFILAATWLPTILIVALAHDLHPAWFVLTFVTALLPGILLNVLSHRAYNYWAVKRGWGMLAMDMYPSPASLPEWELMRRSSFDPENKGDIRLLHYLKDYLERRPPPDHETRESMLSALYRVFWDYQVEIQNSITWLIGILLPQDWLLKKPETIEKVRASAFSPGGRWLALAIGGTIYLEPRWEGGERKEIVFSGQHVLEIVFSPDRLDGNQMAIQHGTSWHDQSVTIFDLTEDLGAKKTLRNLGYVENIVFSRDGNRLAVAHGTEDIHGITFFNTATGNQDGRIEIGMRVFDLAFNQTGDRLAVRFGEDSVSTSLSFFNLATGEAEPAFQEELTSDVAFSRDGYLALDINNMGNPTLEVFNFISREWIVDLPVEFTSHILFHPTEDKLALIRQEREIDGANIIIYDRTTGARLLTFPQRVGMEAHPCFSPDGRVLAIASRIERAIVRLDFFDSTTGIPLGQLFPGLESIDRISYSPDGREIIIQDRLRRLIRIPLAEGLPLSPEQSPVQNASRVGQLFYAFGALIVGVLLCAWLGDQLAALRLFVGLVTGTVFILSGSLILLLPRGFIARTIGKKIEWNDQAMKKLTPFARAFVVAEETWHAHSPLRGWVDEIFAKSFALVVAAFLPSRWVIKAGLEKWLKGEAQTDADEILVRALLDQVPVESLGLNTPRDAYARALYKQDKPRMGEPDATLSVLNPRAPDFKTRLVELNLGAQARGTPALVYASGLHGKVGNIIFVERLDPETVRKALGGVTIRKLDVNILSKDPSFLDADLIAALKKLEETPSREMAVRLYLLVILRDTLEAAVLVNGRELERMLELELKARRVAEMQA